MTVLVSNFPIIILLQVIRSHAQRYISCPDNNCDGSTFDCNDEDCYLDCDGFAGDRSCRNVTITASKSLFVTCEDTRCGGSTFTCDQCGFNCEGASSCDFTIVTIDFGDFFCGGEGCDQIQVCYSPSFTLITIYALHYNVIQGERL